MKRILRSEVPADITVDELRLAGRNHSMPLEALRYPVTPIGLHYLLTHFDIVDADAATWRLRLEGAVERPVDLSLGDLAALPQATHTVTMECAGNGRARTTPRWHSQPWLDEAVGTAQWSGVPLVELLTRAGLAPNAREVLFTGADRGVQGEVEQDYQRSLPIADAIRPEVLLATTMNGVPLPPQHGFPLRLIVPGWYGMTSVKWLRSIEVLTEPFRGFQQAEAYHVRHAGDDQGMPVTRMLPRSLMIPPGIPDFSTRRRIVEAGKVLLEGRAWSGQGAMAGVEVSSDGGSTWAPAVLQPPADPLAWHGWSFEWNAVPGDCVLCCRAADSAGNIQPQEQNWTTEGVCNNMVQHVEVTVAGPSAGVKIRS